MTSPKRIYLILIFVGLTLSVGAQRIKATASLDSANILIGDQVRLTLEIEYPQNVEVQFPLLPDIIDEKIEVLSSFGVDTIGIEGSEMVKLITTRLITSFDSGSYQIPPFWFKIKHDGRIDSIPSNGLILNVNTLQVDLEKGPTGIKLPYAAPVTLKEVIPWVFGLIILFALIFFIIYAISRKKSNQPIFSIPIKPPEPPHVVAIRELDRIKDAKLWQKGAIKLFYSEVSDTLRRYLDGRFDIPAMEQTSAETIGSFRYRKDLISDKSFEYISQILNLADMVKFAKYEPLPDDNNLTLLNAYFFINDTRVIEPVTSSSLDNLGENDQHGSQNEKKTDENITEHRPVKDAEPGGYEENADNS